VLVLIKPHGKREEKRGKEGKDGKGEEGLLIVD